MNLSSLFALPVLVLALPFPATFSAQEPSRPPVGDAAKGVSASIVRIEAYGDDGRVAHSSAGFVVSAEGAILTTYRAIEHAKQATVWLPNQDAYDEVSVLDVDKRKDLALIKIKAIGLAPLKLGRSDQLQAEEPLHAVTTTRNTSTSVEEVFKGMRQESGYRLLELSNPKSHAAAGSPLLNSRGEVVAIMASDIDEHDSNAGSNIDLAIPVDYAAGMIASPGVARSLEAFDEADSAAAGPRAAAQQMPSTPAQPSPALLADPISYLAQKIRVWHQEDAARELGPSGASQDAVDIQTDDVIAGTLKYNAPIAPFAEIDLTFDQDSKLLTVAYLYPKSALASSTVRATLGSDFVKFVNPNGNPSYVYQKAQRTISIQADPGDRVTNIMIW